jgi:hypothetical protein
MTSISATAGSSNYLSPLQLLQNELRTEVSSRCDRLLRSKCIVFGADRHQLVVTIVRAAPPAAPMAFPGDLQSKIDTPIAGEVSSGKLTSDQVAQRKCLKKLEHRSDSIRAIMLQCAAHPLSADRSWHRDDGRRRRCDARGARGRRSGKISQPNSPVEDIMLPKVPWNLKSPDKSSALHNLKNRRQRERRRDRRVFS